MSHSELAITQTLKVDLIAVTAYIPINPISRFLKSCGWLIIAAKTAGRFHLKLRCSLPFPLLGINMSFCTTAGVLT